MPRRADNQRRETPKPSRPYMPGYGILDAKHGRGLLPWGWVRKKIAKPHVYWISTTGEGVPHMMPVWGIWMDDAFYFSTGPRSRKARNLKSNPSCVVGCLTGKEDADESIILEGIAKKITDKPTIKQFASVYEAKYHWDMSTFNEPIYAVHPRVVFAFSAYGDFVGTATRWTFGSSSKRESQMSLETSTPLPPPPH